MKVGILAIQGAIVEHEKVLKDLGVETVLVKLPDDLAAVNGLIIPGGESTTIKKLLDEGGLTLALQERVRGGMPVWGTCAGAILLAREVVGEGRFEPLNLIDVVIERNAYGRQVESFECEIDFDGKKTEAVFIRAPRIKKTGKGVEILSELETDADKYEIVAARKDNILITTFHPELTDKQTIHQYFLSMFSPS